MKSVNYFKVNTAGYSAVFLDSEDMLRALNRNNIHIQDSKGLQDFLKGKKRKQFVGNTDNGTVRISYNAKEPLPINT